MMPPPRDEVLWCAGRASAHLDIAIEQVGDLYGHLEIVDPRLVEMMRPIGDALWAVRSALIQAVEGCKGEGDAT